MTQDEASGLLTTARLRLLPAHEHQAAQAAAFHQRNAQHLAPWDPPSPPGYAMDASFEGRGLMREALEAVVAHAFSPALNLHRIQANVRPENRRSLGLPQRLGFEEEGLAREYLFIDGAWRDHRMFARRNPAFVGEPR